MATMKSEMTIETLLEKNLEHFTSLGVPRKTNDLQAYLCYRQGLTFQEREMFDDLIKRGTFPGAAAETIEIASGRIQPYGTQAEPEQASVTRVAA